MEGRGGGVLKVEVHRGPWVCVCVCDFLEGAKRTDGLILFHGADR